MRGLARRVSLALAVALVAACGSGSSGGGPQATLTPAPSPTPGEATPTPTPGAPPAPTLAPTPPEPTPTATPASTPGEPPPLRLTEVASGLDQPLYVAAAPGEPGRLYVVEQSGRIRVIDGGETSDDPFLDLSDLVSCCGERGLLGLAFHPEYARNGRLIVNYTNRSGDTEIAEYARASTNPPRAAPDPVRLFFRVDQPFPNHNGGMLAFAPDGTLVIALGDGGAAGDPQNNAQNVRVKLGKLLRIDVDRYPEPPPGNVADGDPAVWHYGLRNPWRFSFDRATGDLWIGDVGQNLWEEVDFAPAGTAGLNFGWRITEGLHCFEPPEDCDTAGLVWPVAEYDHNLGCSVTGGFVYRGRAIPDLVGHYLFGDYCSNRVWSLVRGAGGGARVVELTPDLDPEERLQGLSSFGEDRDGEVYLTSHEGGAVFRLDAAGEDGRRVAPQGEGTAAP